MCQNLMEVDQEFQSGYMSIFLIRDLRHSKITSLPFISPMVTKKIVFNHNTKPAISNMHIGTRWKAKLKVVLKLKINVNFNLTLKVNPNFNLKLKVLLQAQNQRQCQWFIILLQLELKLNVTSISQVHKSQTARGYNMKTCELEEPNILHRNAMQR